MSKQDEETSLKLKQTKDRKELEQLARKSEMPGPLLRGRIKPDGTE